MSGAADNQHCLHGEAQTRLRDGAEPLPSRCPGLITSSVLARPGQSQTKDIKIFQLFPESKCLFLLPRHSATSGADFIFATANIRISDGIFLFLIILFCQINSSFISKRISYELWRIYIKFHFVLLQHLKSRVHISEEQTFTKILNKSQMQRISLT